MYIYIYIYIYTYIYILSGLAFVCVTRLPQIFTTNAEVTEETPSIILRSIHVSLSIYIPLSRYICVS